MNSQAILNSVRLPARLDAAQTAALLGFADHDIPVLVSSGLIRALANPSPGSPRFFAACEIQKLTEDPEFLARATRVMTKHWRSKNARRSAQA